MKRLQLLGWSGSVLSPPIRSCRPRSTRLIGARYQSSAAVPAFSDSQSAPYDESNINEPLPQNPDLPTPPPEAIFRSPKLSALHARLSLPTRLPLQTLARTLVDSSADQSIHFNNHPFSVLGTDLLTYYTTEHLICHYPRVPISVLWAAIYAYVGPKTLTEVTKEWGIEYAADPGREVDPGLLQFKRVGPESETDAVPPSLDPAGSGDVAKRGIGSMVVHDQELGESRDFNPSTYGNPVSASRASATFVRALMGAVYLHGGRPAAKTFFKEHFMSRQLSISDLFSFSQPTRDLSKLCAREGFEAPVARIISETGRKSRHPVFIVGIFSGKDKLGEGAGSSLTEARFRAAAAALKGWYLYSPLTVRVPSSMEDEGAKPWEPAYIDPGEIIV